MIAWLMDMIMKKGRSYDGMLFRFTLGLGWTNEDENPVCLAAIEGHSLSSTLYLIAHCFLDRDGALKAFTSTTAVGCPVLLIVMWTHVKGSDLEKYIFVLTANVRYANTP